MNNIIENLTKTYTVLIMEKGFDYRKILAQIKAESNFDYKAISKAGAIGLMQVMPSTAKDFGYKKEELFDPERNLECGIIYMQKMLNMWDKISVEEERWYFALASYNAGIGNIKSAQRRARRENYEAFDWTCVSQKLWDITGKHAKETINYVARVKRYYHEYKNKEVKDE